MKHNGKNTLDEMQDQKMLKMEDTATGFFSGAWRSRLSSSCCWAEASARWRGN